MSRKTALRKTIVFWICLIVSIVLGVAGFLIPPKGQIDPSCLTFIGLLLAFSVVWQIPVIIEAAGYVKMTKGDMTIEAKGQKED